MIDMNLAQWNIPGIIKIFEVAPNYPVISITNNYASADIALHGAQVMRFKPREQEPVIWLSEAARYTEGKAIRGGIPICWPWFGDKTDSPEGKQAGRTFPAHGFARTCFWTLQSVCHTDESGTEILFTLKESEETMQLWPHRFTLELKIVVSDSLTVDLSIKNSDSTYFVFTGALHTYLALGDITQSTVQGLDGVPYIDKLTDDHKTQVGDFSITSELDNIYQPTSSKVVILDKVLRRELHIDKKGSQSTVVWNPWIEKSSRMNDFEEGGYRHMICVEAANTDGDVIVLQPQESHCLSTTISAIQRE